MLDKIKLILRFDDSILDGDILETIDAAKADLILCGVDESRIIDTNPLILRAIKTYCKAEYAADEKESSRYMNSYCMLRNHLSMSIDFNIAVVVV